MLSASLPTVLPTVCPRRGDDLWWLRRRRRRQPVLCVGPDAGRAVAHHRPDAGDAHPARPDAVRRGRGRTRAGGAVVTRDSELADLVGRLAGVRVLAVGDVMLDRFVYGGVERISPEAPVQVLRTEREQAMLGGVGHVVRNMRTQAASVCLSTLLG